MFTVTKTILPCGLTVLTGHNPYFPSFALSYTLRSGSRGETLETNGMHHMAEHMVFKGSKMYNYGRAAGIPGRMCSRVNACTTREMTRYFLTAPAEDLVPAFDLLTDMLMNPTFHEAAFTREKKVIVREIDEAVNNPGDHVFETFYRHFFKDNAIGFPIRGEKNNLLRWTCDDLRDFFRDKYRPENLLLSAAGKVEHRKLSALAEKAFSGFPAMSPPDFSFKTPTLNTGKCFERKRGIQKDRILIGLPGIPISSSRRYRFMVMNNILGGGIGSRLYRKAANMGGSISSVGTFADDYYDMGLHMIYAEVSPRAIRDYLNVVRDEIHCLKRDGVSGEEVQRAKESLKSTVILDVDNNFAIMKFIANHQLYLKKSMELEEIIAVINEISVDDINRLSSEFLELEKAMVFFYGDSPPTIAEAVKR